MRTITFKNVLHGVCHQMGINPATGLTTDLALAYAEFINLRLKEAYEWAFWPDLMVIERRAYRQTHDSTEAYAAGDEVYSSVEDEYYVAAQVVPAATAITNTTYWTVLTDFNRYVPWDPPAGTTGLTKIGEVDLISNRDPRIYTSANFIKGFWISADGIQVPGEAGNQVYVRFRTRPPVFSSIEWSATETYAADDVRYVASTGESYRALSSNLNQNPATTSGIWVKVDFPYIFETWVKRAAYSDALKDDGQLEKAESVLGEAEDPPPGTAYFELQRLQDVIFSQQGQQNTAEVIR